MHLRQNVLEESRSKKEDPIDQGRIDLPISRHAIKRKQMAVNLESGKPAVTHWRCRKRFLHAVLLELELETGRTHQIRVHLQELGAAKIGDPVYGEPPSQFVPKLRATVKNFLARHYMQKS